MKAAFRLVFAFLFTLAPAAASAAQAVAPTASPPIAAQPGLGTVRLRIDPGVGDQEAAIRQLLGAYPFVQIAEPADYLVTTKPDFPLDIALTDLHQPRELWRARETQPLYFDNAPALYSIGNLAEPDTAGRLAAMLTAAARNRAVLDRSLASMQGVEACVMIDEPDEAGAPATPPECVPMDRLGSKVVIADFTSTIRVRNTSDGDRYVSVAAADGNLKQGWFGMDGEPKVRKLAPGETAEFKPMIAVYFYPNHPRIFVLASKKPIDVGTLAQSGPLDPTHECPGSANTTGCQPTLSGIALNDDLAVRSVQLYVTDEPMPAMGNGSDTTALMAVWMAQFYSVLPYTAADIAADAKLPDDQRQFLRERTYEERQHRCGASLIAPNLVLTAAHCVAKGQYAGDGIRKMMKDRRVRLGSRMLGDRGWTYAISAVAVHPGYDGVHPNHDLALLLLQPDRGSAGAKVLKPLAIADKPLPGGVDALAFGWGLTGAVAPNGNIMMSVDHRIQGNAEVLQYGELESVTLNECRRKLPGEVAPGMLCMYSRAALSGGQSAEGVFTCRGDSGGPLVRQIGKRDVLVGVVSWSKGCGYKDYPSVFTDAGSYSAWIAAARRALKPGLAIRPADPARPALGAGRTSPQ